MYVELARPVPNARRFKILPGRPIRDGPAQVLDLVLVVSASVNREREGKRPKLFRNWEKYFSFPKGNLGADNAEPTFYGDQTLDLTHRRRLHIE